ncbi:MAG: hypothetical protein KDC66_21510, partial [Phaeodactylibacter sp.]|nr:hypothetical protein [Phaeodactylibacter sp.]
MKKPIILVCTLALFLALATTANAQVYKSAVGARLGYPLSLSFKYFLGESPAIEVYAGGRWYSGYNWYNVSGAYLVHKPLSLEGVEGLQWYVGGGASVYFWNYRVYLGEKYANTTVGIQGYLGLDLALPNVPLNVTADWVP